MVLGVGLKKVMILLNAHYHPAKNGVRKIANFML
jgi:hypothetical protein